MVVIPLTKKNSYTFSIENNEAQLTNINSGAGTVWFNVENTLGDLIHKLETTFPKVACKYPYEYDITSLRKHMMDNITRDIRIYDLPEDSSSLINFYEFINEESGSSLKMDQVEKFRIEHHISTAPIVRQSEDGVEFILEDVNWFTQIIYALLYYYALNGYRIKCCRFCGKWYAFKDEKAQKNYCNRPFTYTDWNGKEKTFPCCQDAREKIKARCDRRSKQIYDVLYSREGFANKNLDSFLSCRDEHLIEIKKNPSFENIVKYEQYLYIECDKYYRRYGRK